MALSRSNLFLFGAFAAMGLVLFIPVNGLSTTGTFALATMVFAAVLWVTEGLPLPATALCVPILLTLFGVFPTMAAALRGFADPIIFLLLAGFVLAEALQKHGIDRRIAYHLILGLGTSPRRLVLAIMSATAFLSMIVSNSATTAMMIPIALGVAHEIGGENHSTGEDDRQASNLEISLLLGTAYAASLGGVGTLIGTPANAIVVSQLEAYLGYQIGFLDWLVIGLPLVIVSLPIAWYLLAFRLFPPEVTDVSRARQRAEQTLTEMGSLDPAGRRTLGITGITAGLWVLGGLDFLFEGVLPAAWFDTLFSGAGSIVGVPHQGVGVPSRRSTIRASSGRSSTRHAKRNSFRPCIAYARCLRTRRSTCTCSRTSPPRFPWISSSNWRTSSRQSETDSRSLSAPPGWLNS